MKCEATETAFILMRKGKNAMSYCIPKPKYVFVVNNHDIVKITFPFSIEKGKVFSARLIDYLCFDYTDDPFVYCAGQIGSLGYYRFRLRFKNFKVESYAPFTLSTRFYDGIFYEISRPLQRPHRKLIGDHQQIKFPIIKKGDRSGFCMIFNEYWNFITLFNDSGKEYVYTQLIDQYSSYTVGKLHEYIFPTTNLAKKYINNLLEGS